jgi:hypothetical protein
MKINFGDLLAQSRIERRRAIYASIMWMAVGFIIGFISGLSW